jgi:spermidine/putrescine transport system substrate-binding protein
MSGHKKSNRTIPGESQMHKPLSRRQILRGSAAAAGGLAVASVIGSPFPVRAAGEDLTLFTWETYHDDPWIVEFTKNTGIKVNVVRAGSVDEMYAKTRSGAIKPDLLFFDSGSIPRYIKANLIVPIDLSKVENAKSITPQLNFKKFNSVDGKLYAVPYNWGTQPLMFDSKVVTSGTDSWGVLWDKKYEGKVSMFDDAYVTIPMIALYVGARDPYNLTDAEFDKCREALKALRPQVRTIARGFDDATATFAAGEATLGYCQNISEVFALQQKGLPFAYSFPKEGTPTWIDNAIITEKGNRPESYKLINAGLDLKWQARFITSSGNNGILSADEAKAVGISPDVLKKTNILDQAAPGFWSQMSIFQPPEDIDKRLEIWNDFKAGTL